jgi:hypothetical protein
LEEQDVGRMQPKGNKSGALLPQVVDFVEVLVEEG